MASFVSQVSQMLFHVYNIHSPTISKMRHLRLQSAPFHSVNLRILQRDVTHFTALSGAHHKLKWHTLHG